MQARRVRLPLRGRDGPARRLRFIRLENPVGAEQSCRPEAILRHILSWSGVSVKLLAQLPGTRLAGLPADRTPVEPLAERTSTPVARRPNRRRLEGEDPGGGLGCDAGARQALRDLALNGTLTSANVTTNATNTTQNACLAGDSAIGRTRSDGWAHRGVHGSRVAAASVGAPTGNCAAVRDARLT